MDDTTALPSAASSAAPAHICNSLQPTALQQALILVHAPGIDTPAPSHALTAPSPSVLASPATAAPSPSTPVVPTTALPSSDDLAPTVASFFLAATNAPPPPPTPPPPDASSMDIDGPTTEELGPTNEERAQLLGVKLQPLVSLSQPLLAGRITGMLLVGLHPDVVATLLESPCGLEARIAECLEVIRREDTAYSAGREDDPLYYDPDEYAEYLEPPPTPPPPPNQPLPSLPTPPPPPYIAAPMYISAEASCFFGNLQSHLGLAFHDLATNTVASIAITRTTAGEPLIIVYGAAAAGDPIYSDAPDTPIASFFPHRATLNPLA